MSRTRRTLAIVSSLLVLAAPMAAAVGKVQIDAKDAELHALLQLLSAQTGIRFAAHPDLATNQFTFATKQMSRTGAVRWLCRACRLSVTRGKDGGWVVGPPSADKGVVKQYKISGLVKDELEADALVSFIKSAILPAFLNREDGEHGGQVPETAAKYEDERLKVLAPPVVHREVLALLHAMAKAKDNGNVETLDVKYESQDLGLFRSGTGSEPPPLKGTVTFELEDATATEAAWQLTSASDVSFYVDPWDKELCEKKLSLKAKDLALASAARQFAEAAGAQLIQYDGAWLLVRSNRKALYESLAVRAYNVSGEFFGRPVAESVARRAKDIRLPDGLPCAVERVGNRVLASMPGPMHKQIDEIVKSRAPTRPPGGEGGWRDRWGRRPWGPRGGRRR